jgi:hypothetical protein
MDLMKAVLHLLQALNKDAVSGILSEDTLRAADAVRKALRPKLRLVA